MSAIRPNHIGGGSGAGGLEVEELLPVLNLEGGDTDEVLMKNSPTNGDWSWQPLENVIDVPALSGATVFYAIYEADPITTGAGEYLNCLEHNWPDSNPPLVEKTSAGVFTVIWPSARPSGNYYVEATGYARLIQDAASRVPTHAYFEAESLTAIGLYDQIQLIYTDSTLAAIPIARNGIRENAFAGAVFNGVGGVTTNASFGCIITRISAGYYRATFTAEQEDVNYYFFGTAGRLHSVIAGHSSQIVVSIERKETTYCEFLCTFVDSGVEDAELIQISLYPSSWTGGNGSVVDANDIARIWYPADIALSADAYADTEFPGTGPNVPTGWTSDLRTGVTLSQYNGQLVFTAANPSTDRHSIIKLGISTGVAHSFTVCFQRKVPWYRFQGAVIGYEAADGKITSLYWIAHDSTYGGNGALIPADFSNHTTGTVAESNLVIAETSSRIYLRASTIIVGTPQIRFEASVDGHTFTLIQDRNMHGGSVPPNFFCGLMNYTTGTFPGCIAIDWIRQNY